MSVDDYQRALRQLRQRIDAHLSRGIHRLCDRPPDCVTRAVDNSITHRRRQQMRGLRWNYAWILSVHTDPRSLCDVHQRVGANLPRRLHRLFDTQPDSSTAADRTDNTGTCHVGTNRGNPVRVVLGRHGILSGRASHNKLLLRALQHHKRYMPIRVHAVRCSRTNTRKDSSANPGRREQVPWLRRKHAGFLPINSVSHALRQLHQRVGALLSCWVHQLCDRLPDSITRSVDSSSDCSDHVSIVH